MRKGEHLVTQIGDVAFGGDGVGRHEDQVIFVPFACDGDVAEIEVTEVRKRYGRGRLLGIRTPSAHRVTPPCAHYTRCGGCRMGHIAYPHQLALKERQVRQLFARIAGLPSLDVLPVIPSPLPFGYRGKAEFHLAGGGGAPWRIGMMALASHDVVEIEGCALCAESINRQLRDCRAALATRRLRPTGDRRVIWSDGPDGPCDGDGEKEEITRIVLDQPFTVPREGFFQANEALVGTLVALVLEMAALTGKETVVDAYGGCGLFSLFLAPRAGCLFGIETDREAVRCAEINLRRAGLGQARFLKGDVGEMIAEELIPRAIRADVIVLDPPRDGCGDGVLPAVAALRPERIVYVSCNPATQARDSLRLAGLGYGLRRLQPLDMFPQTAHIEAVALFTPLADGEGERPEESSPTERP